MRIEILWRVEVQKFPHASDNIIISDKICPTTVQIHLDINCNSVVAFTLSKLDVTRR